MVEPKDVLTISAKDYCEMVGKELKDYEAKGVDIIVESDFGINVYDEEELPEGTEVIVDYTPLEAQVGTSTGVGTALVPKKK